MKGGGAIAFEASSGSLYISQSPIVGNFEELPIAAQARANPPKTDTNEGKENRQEQDNSPHKDSNGRGKYGFN